MDEKQLFEHAQKMFLAEKGRKDVIEFFLSNGVEEARAETLATEAFLSIRETRRAMANEVEDNDFGGGSGGGGGIGSILIGIVLIIAGTVATMNSDTIWYGAILVGIVSLISGIAKAAS